jgi:hypothetical protein
LLFTPVDLNRTRTVLIDPKWRIAGIASRAETSIRGESKKAAGQAQSGVKSILFADHGRRLVSSTEGVTRG